MSPAAPKLDPDELAALEEQRDFLLRSLTDLDREHDAGDLEDDDYATLKDDYTARAAEVIRAIADRHAAFGAAKRPRTLGRSLAWAAGIVAFAVLAGVVAAGAMGARKAGESASGGVTVSQTASQRANNCIPKMQTDPNGAEACFQKILDEDPENAVALTWSAWLYSLAAQQADDPQRTQFQALAAVRLDEAVNADPSYSFARAFRAVVAYRNGRYADAQRYLDEFKARNPSAQAAQIMKQMNLEENIAKGLASQASSTTTPSTTTTVPN